MRRGSPRPRLFLGLLALLLAGPHARAGGATDDTLRVADWLVIGPFSAGSREPFIDPIWPAEPATLSPRAGDSLASWMAPGGFVRWTRVPGEGGEVAFAFEGVDWDGLGGLWGNAGSICSGLAFGLLRVDRPGAYWIDALGVGSLYIDGARFLGSPYGNPAFRTPVRLDRGEHRVLLRVSGGGPREVGFQLLHADGDLGLLDHDLTLPDLVAGEPLDAWGAAPVVNLSGREIRGARLQFGDGRIIARTVVPIPPLPPEAILKVPFPVRSVAPPEEGRTWRGEIRLLPLGGVEYATETGAHPGSRRGLLGASCSCSIEVRDPGEARLVTFRSDQDGSVQMFAVLPPAGMAAGRSLRHPAGGTAGFSGGESAGGAAGSSPRESVRHALQRTSGANAREYALILSLHGAGVDPLPQVRSYAPKDWAFVIAATNTRPFGFDWQDWGRLNAIQTLDEALGRYPIDPDRVVLVGHSMGGHGTWHVGLSHADRFAALCPSAGWSSFETYVPFTLRRDHLSGEPRLRQIWERAMAPDNTLSFLMNARGMPVFVLHGGADDNVPVFQGRLLAEKARDEGARVTYREAPGMGHWWDRPETPGVDCVDDPEMMAFIRTQRRVASPDSVFLRTADLGTCDRSHWIIVDRALRPFDRVEVEGRIVRGPEPAISIRTSGAAGITIAPPERLGHGRVRVTIDSDRMQIAGGRPVRLSLERSRWRVVEDDGDEGASWGRGPKRRFRGPLKAAFFEPFVYVYGTRGGGEAVARMRRMAVLDAQGWYLRADGYAPVLPDTAVTPEILSSRNLILYGTPSSNAVIETIMARLPIEVDAGGVTVGPRRYEGRGLAARFVCANPRCPDRLVEIVAGTDLAGLELAGAANPCFSGSGFPDFLVYDAAVRRLGWSGIRAAGFFDAGGDVPTDGLDAFLR